MVSPSLVILVAVFVLLCFFAFRNKRLLPGPTPIPILGNLLQLRVKHLHKQLETWATRYGELYEFWILGSRNVVVSNKQIAKQLLWDRPDLFTRPKDLRDRLRAVGAEGLFSLEGEAWKRHRKLLSPAFSKAAVSRMMHCITIPTERMLKKWQTRIKESPNGYVTMEDPRLEMSRLTLDVITFLACGYDLNSVESSDSQLALQLQEYFNAISDVMFPSANSLLGPTWKKSFREAQRAATEVVNKMIELTRQEVMAEKDGKATSDRSNLLKEMILTNINGDFLSDKELAQEVLVVMLAGLDTTSILLGWSIYYLTKYPEYQHKIREEVKKVVGETAIPSVDHLSNLKMTTYFLQETLRMRGPAPLNIVCNIEPVEINGITFPANTNFFVMLRLTESRGLTDADVFYPERWENASAPGSSFQATLPFGGGPRVCPGRPLAMMEATVALATLVRSFQFELDSEDPGEIMNFLMIPSPYRVKLRAV